MKSNVISLQEYETMQTAVAVAEAQRDALNVALAHKQVRSPIDGSVVHRLVSVGEYVRPGTPLFDLVDDDPLKLRGDVPERFADEIAVGQPVQIKVDAYPDVVFDGHAWCASAPPPIPRTARSPSRPRCRTPTAAEGRLLRHRQHRHPLRRPRRWSSRRRPWSSFAGVTKLFVVRDDIAYERQVRIGTRDDMGLVEVLEGLQLGRDRRDLGARQARKRAAGDDPQGRGMNADFIAEARRRRVAKLHASGDLRASAPQR